MAARIHFRRGTATQWADANPVLADGEPGYDQTNNEVRVGNGVDTWDALEPVAATEIDGLDSSDFVRATGSVDQTVTGTKSFSAPVPVADATGATHAVNRQTGDARYLTVAAANTPPTPNVQVFTSSGTWTKPTAPSGHAAYQTAYVLAIGGGGGGGSGRRGAAGSARCGGGGGAGGPWAEARLSITALGTNETVTVGAGGAGGSAASANDTSGSNGTAGGVSIFGTSSTDGWLKTGAAGNGDGGGNGASGGGGGVSTIATATGLAGTGSASAGTVGGNSSISAATPSPGGGAAGGGVTTGDAQAAGGTGASRAMIPSLATAPTAGTAGGGNGGAGTSPQGSSTAWWPGRGGAGGGGNSAGAGGAGGNGGLFGGGGGGGGGGTNGASGGAGGNGADGLVVVICT